MESILTPPATLVPAPPTPPPKDQRKRPGLAFVLSLVFPGLGHLYCGKRKTGVIVAFFSAIAFAGVIFLKASQPFWGPALRASIILYAFAFLDAFYDAREINAGMEPFIVGNNPRIAAMLNLLTNGFGYFYLGERKKGLIWFFVLRIFAGVVRQAGKQDGKIALSVVLEIVLVIISIDAYRLARAQMRAAFPECDLDPFASPGGLTAPVPMALAAVFALNYIALVAFGASMPIYAPLDQSAATVRKSAQGYTYSNPRYRVELTAPEDWDLDATRRDQFVHAKKHKGGCSVQLLAEANNPIFGAEAVKRAILDTNRNYILLSDQPAELAGLPGRKLAFSTKVKEVDVLQNYFLVQKGLTRYSLIETMASVLADDCNADFDRIRPTVKLAR